MYPANRRRILGPSVMDRLNPQPRRTVRLKVIPSPKKKGYKIPKTPSSGIGVGP